MKADVYYNLSTGSPCAGSKWEVCLLNVALGPLYIHEEGDWVGDRVKGSVTESRWHRNPIHNISKANWATNGYCSWYGKGNLGDRFFCVDILIKEMKRLWELLWYDDLGNSQIDRRVIVGLSRAPLGRKLGFCCRSRALVMLQNKKED